MSLTSYRAAPPRVYLCWADGRPRNGYTGLFGAGVFIVKVLVRFL
jgi:hypothetical protein